jgi:hypothetical protein
LKFIDPASPFAGGGKVNLIRAGPKGHVGRDKEIPLISAGYEDLGYRNSAIIQDDDPAVEDNALVYVTFLINSHGVTSSGGPNEMIGDIRSGYRINGYSVF